MPMILALAGIGAAAGLVAARLMGMRIDPWVAALVGAMGALLAGLVTRLASAMAAPGPAVPLAAVLGAVVAVWLWRVVVQRR